MNVLLRGGGVEEVDVDPVGIVFRADGDDGGERRTVWFQFRPCIEPESSMRKTVSKRRSGAYGSVSGCERNEEAISKINWLLYASGKKGNLVWYPRSAATA